MIGPYSLERYSLSILVVVGLLAAVIAITGQHTAHEESIAPTKVQLVAQQDGVDDVPDDFGPDGTYDTSTGPTGSTNTQEGGQGNPAAPNRIPSGQVPFNTTPFDLDEGTASGATTPPGAPQELFNQEAPADGALSDGVSGDTDFYQPAPGSFGEGAGLGAGAGIGDSESFDAPSSDDGGSASGTTGE